MKRIIILILLLIFLITSCGPVGYDQVSVAELPDPAIYALTLSELPDVRMSWQRSYNQTTIEQGYKWSYLAYQAYQPGNLGVELESAFAVNNDVVLYEVDMSREDLPQPPQALGNIQDVSWKSVTQTHRLGDKSAVWKTNLGELLTPVWWLEFYQGHAYVRISLLGFPDQIAPPIIYGLGDILVSRLPRSVDKLRSDAATVVATQPSLPPTVTPQASLSPSLIPLSSTPSVVTTQTGFPVLRYTTPPGETGMVSYFDETANQLVDGTVGLDDILIDQGLGTAYEWVGWTDLTDPITLTFTLQGDVSISAVEIGFNHRDGLGVFVPSQVTINGVSFEPAADAVPNNRRSDLTFTGRFNGPVVTIVLHHRGRGWILVDEVRFLPGN
ncbi:MAG: hypothetical protein WAM09_16525 [Anaerolineales bacterium]